MALHTAAREGNVEELKALIQSGSKIDEKDMHSRTPLHMASWAGHVECVNALMEAGANVHSAAMDDMSSLHFAAQQGHVEVSRALLNAGLKVNSKTRKGTNALQFAAKKGHLNLVQYLIRRKANVSATDRNGKTALDLASDDAVKAALQTALEGPHDEKTVGPSRAVGDAAAAETATDAAGEVAEAHPHVPIGPQPMEKKERGNLRKRTDASGAGEEAAAQEPAAKRLHKVALSHLGDEDEADTS